MQAPYEDPRYTAKVPNGTDKLIEAELHITALTNLVHDLCWILQVKEGESITVKAREVMANYPNSDVHQ